MATRWQFSREFKLETVKVGNASKVARFDKLSLLLVIVIALAFLGERPSVLEWVGILMVGTGVMVLALK
jgi:transporter family protein